MSWDAQSQAVGLFTQSYFILMHENIQMDREKSFDIFFKKH